MDRRSRSLANAGIAVGFLASAFVILVVDDGGTSLAVGFGAVGAVVLIVGLIQLANSRRGGSVENRP